MPATTHRGRPWVEWALTIPVLAGLIYTTWYFFTWGYLPQPYFYEPNGVYMDFFSVGTYAHTEDAFEVFGTIYPPLSFVLLKLVTWGPCYANSGLESARDCDFIGTGSMYVIYAINAVLIYLTFRKIDRRTALPRAFALGFGLPMTYTLERGNVLLFCFTCIILAHGPLLKSARLRWLFAAMTVNFKVYLVGTLFAQLLRRRWRWFEGAMITTVLVYLVTYAIYGHGLPSEIYENVRYYAGGYSASSLLDLWYPSSLVPTRTLLENEAAFPVMTAVGSTVVEWGLILVKTITYGTLVSIALAAAGSFWRPTVVPMFRLVFLSIAFALAVSEVGGYTQIFVVLFVFMEAWRGFGRRLAIISAYILCTSLDIPFEYLFERSAESFLAGGRAVNAEYWLTIGVFVRPLLFYLIANLLAWVSIRDIWADARAHGWRTPWSAGWKQAAAVTAR